VRIKATKTTLLFNYSQWRRKEKEEADGCGFVERKKGGELLAAGSGGKRCTFVGFKADQGLRHRSNWVQMKKGLKKSNLMRLNSFYPTSSKP
jgi:hypothetical protein